MNKEIVPMILALFPLLRRLRALRTEVERRPVPELSEKGTHHFKLGFSQKFNNQRWSVALDKYLSALQHFEFDTLDINLDDAHRVSTTQLIESHESYLHCPYMRRRPGIWAH